ncbi:hypothetical protein SAMN04488047_15411 [Tranquillimonas alkanivorans]|uniref:Uncharacterized protein n=1 Tax=Tranquillimonas alkanivorans TaxID=441119 RepID=A0A1I5WS82_9RHOB|nr:hypothetical protein SAMN04488047_15411 [Tranquillimonas alkanivorans]
MASSLTSGTARLLLRSTRKVPERHSTLSSRHPWRPLFLEHGRRRLVLRRLNAAMSNRRDNHSYGQESSSRQSTTIDGTWREASASPLAQGHPAAPANSSWRTAVSLGSKQPSEATQHRPISAQVDGRTACSCSPDLGNIAALRPVELAVRCKCENDGQSNARSADFRLVPAGAADGRKVGITKIGRIADAPEEVLLVHFERGTFRTSSSRWNTSTELGSRAQSPRQQPSPSRDFLTSSIRPVRSAS